MCDRLESNGKECWSIKPSFREPSVGELWRFPRPMAADPTYPLLPIVSITCSALLLLVLGTFIRLRSWNLGVSVLCFWIFLENLTNGISAILWADNADIKAVVYCDIGTRVSKLAYTYTAAM